MSYLPTLLSATCVKSKASTTACVNCDISLLDHDVGNLILAECCMFSRTVSSDIMMSSYIVLRVQINHTSSEGVERARGELALLIHWGGKWWREGGGRGGGRNILGERSQ